MNLEIVILAAGKGTRMRSSQPKVMHTLAGQPLLQHVLNAAANLKPKALHVVVGSGAELVRSHFEGQQFEGCEINWVYQDEQLGTGHAVLQALPSVSEDSQVLVLFGDGPLIQPKTLESIVSLAGSKPALLTAELPDPAGLGRIIRDEQGKFCAVVEDKDASAEQKKICEINTGVLVAPANKLREWLPQVKAENKQQEYYLPDILPLALAEGIEVGSANPEFAWEIEGVNDRIQLSIMERAYQRRQAKALMVGGVTLADPERLDVRGTLSCDQDVFIDVNVVFEGNVTIESGARIGPNCVISDSHIGAGTEIKAHSVLEEARTEGSNTIGPYARLRPGTVLAKNAKIGNFVETKKANIGEGSKVNHLSYIGDSEIGRNANIGAGTITCNYDGANKYPTTIGDGAFIGSNSTLVHQ